ncbi:MAG: hypothetical protein IJK02_12200 [Clostridia bacterium]|nr:hypothetical protein [Clostridia bacterium]MBR0510058.1 hypothetical protein [Clostridia bacterium]
MSSIISKSGDSDTITVDLGEIVSYLLKHLVHIILVAVLAGALTYIGTYFLVTPMYRAHITLYVNNTANKEATASITQGDLNASTHLVNTYAAIIKSDAFMDRVVEDAGVQDRSVSSLISNITTSPVNDTEVFMVYVKDANAETAARIANSIANIAPQQLPDIIEGSSVKIVDRAKVPTSRYSPNYTRNAALGLLLGAVLSTGIFILIKLQDTTLKTAADFEHFGLPVLVSIPDISEAIKEDAKGYTYGYTSYAYANAHKKAKSRQSAAQRDKSKTEAKK